MFEFLLHLASKKILQDSSDEENSDRSADTAILSPTSKSLAKKVDLETDQSKMRRN